MTDKQIEQIIKEKLNPTYFVSTFEFAFVVES